jgi:drug/metabolite transporter (DMT)-like permease
VSLALGLALAASFCFGLGLVTSRVGLRAMDARAGAAISVPTAALLFVLAAPFTIDAGGFSLAAVLVFALVGVFFPAVVTILTFRSNELLGPTVTSALSGTAPLFALPAAWLLLGEAVPAQAAIASAAVVLGIALLSWKGSLRRPELPGWAILWPLAGALVRGVAQAGAKAGLLLWPNPFAAGLIGYSVSSATVLGAARLGRARKPPRTPQGIAWFALTGVLNGAAVLLMYAALTRAPVALVAPVVATYPLVTALLSAALLRQEPLTPRILTGAAVTVAAIVYLVASRG